MKKRKFIPKKAVQIMVCSMVLSLAFGMTVFAKGEPKIISGTKKLLTDAGTWLTGLIAAATIAASIFNGLKWQAAGKDEKPAAAKAVKNSIIIGVICTCLSGIITLVFGYYT